GQYALTGSFPKAQTPTPPPPPSTPPPPTSQPRIAVTQGSTAIADGGSVSFGNVDLGGHIDKTFTVRNSGTAPLTLQILKDLPLGFTILSNVGSATLQAGQSTTFTVRMYMNWTSRFAGAIKLQTNDANDPVFAINVSGWVLSPEVNLIGATAVADGGT